MTDLDDLRNHVDSANIGIIYLLAQGKQDSQEMRDIIQRRRGLVRQIGKYKVEHNLPIRDSPRQEQQKKSVRRYARSICFDPDKAEAYINGEVEESVAIQESLGQDVRARS